MKTIISNILTLISLITIFNTAHAVSDRNCPHAIECGQIHCVSDTACLNWPLAIAQPQSNGLTISKTNTVITPINEPDLPAISGRSAIVIDRNTGDVIGVKQPDVRRAIASTTKIMTAILAIEAINSGSTSKSTVVNINCEQDFEGGGGIGLSNGDRVSLLDLLYLMMVKSYNDAAVSIGCHISGNRGAFLRLMNIRAISLGLSNTSFVSISGRDPDDYIPGCQPFEFESPACAHYSTARDMAKLAKFALDYRLFSRVVKTQSYTTTTWRRSGQNMDVSFDNTNGLIDAGSANYFSGSYGVKTGTTDQAGACLVFAARKFGRDIIGVTLFAGPPDNSTRYSDARIMIDWSTELDNANTPRPLSKFQRDLILHKY